MDPDVSCQYTGTDMSLDTDSTGAAWSNNPCGQGASTPCSRPFQLPHKKTDADARATTVNPANEHVGKGKTKYPSRRRRKEEVKQMGTFRAAACAVNKNKKIEGPRRSNRHHLGVTGQK